MSTPSERQEWLRTNRGVAVCLTVLCSGLLVYLLNQDWVFDKQRDGFQLGFFSVMGAVAMLICSLALLIDRQKSATTPEMADIRLRHVANCLLALGLMGLYFILAWNSHFAQDWLRPILDLIPMAGEFVFWTPIFLAIGMHLLGVRPWRSAIIAGVVIGLVIFGLFRVIGITLPSNYLLS